ncbi:hypothetical protein P775_10735 [Puniceibacterium antarcticum]|uniref:Uncharacterized protein n=1 Tax=Puniceibacterium antarcticum TaxID=1206336 RepID=A0A2G8REW5_9RHOB|nr:hypothetical protein [Puniceibacterium antarcticum]PIL20136.1 hypothetical protein P775_10735 [Puniceibacterium antarcticum]
MLVILPQTFLRATFQKGLGLPGVQRGQHRWSVADLRERNGEMPND